MNIAAWLARAGLSHPTLPAVVFNLQNDMFKDKRVRWALALLIDIKAVSMASYRGAATLSAIAIPPRKLSPAGANTQNGKF